MRKGVWKQALLRVEWRTRKFMSKLSEIDAGKTVIVKEITADERLISRTSSMGIIIGSRLEVLKNERKQPLLLFCRDTMVAVNRRECEKIKVEVAS
jgi:ferrous iron transport protein A